jgi:hypothetical protein
MGNDVIVPPHDFEHPSRWYYGVQEIKKYIFGADSSGITPIANFMEIRLTILSLLHCTDG